MSVLDDFDKIVANQVQDPVYQKRLEIQKRLEMVRWLEKYPDDWEGISQWFVRRAIVHGNLNYLQIGEDQICYGLIPIDLMGIYGVNLNRDRDKLMESLYMVAVRDSETKEIKTMFLTAKEYNEFVRLKHYGVYEFTR